jgi:putative glutamine amidotransferase
MTPPRTPIVGITTYGHDHRPQFRLPSAYVQALRRAGALVWMIPPGEGRVGELLGRLDAVVLAGGGDVDPALYGGRLGETFYAIDRVRDDGEIALVHALLERRVPTLAICRGMQIANVALGGSLIEHLPDEVGQGIAHRGDGPYTSSLHPVSVSPGSRLAGLTGPEPMTSSSHHQALRRVAAGLTVTARAADGTIEAVEIPEQPFFLGVQWHPEETSEHDPAQQRLFEALIEATQRT